MIITQAQTVPGLLDVLLSDFWVVAMFGFLHFAFKNHNWLHGMMTEGHKKKHSRDDHELLAVIYGARTMGLGVLVVIFSYIIAGMVFYLVPGNPALAEGARSGMWLNQTFQFSVAGLMITGYALILSAGGRWLVQAAKFIATISILAVLAASILTYL